MNTVFVMYREDLFSCRSRSVMLHADEPLFVLCRGQQ